jgi:hypothetical protein
VFDDKDIAGRAFGNAAAAEHTMASFTPGNLRRASPMANTLPR